MGMPSVKLLVGLGFNITIFCLGTYLRSSKTSQRGIVGKGLQVLSALGLALYLVGIGITHFLLHDSPNL
jgi:hypothetical protein